MSCGTERIRLQNQKIKQEKRVGIMTHVVVGYPSLQKTEELVIAMAENGADFVELQIPFSDPIADGPTILKASQDALDGGTTVQDCFDLAESLRNKGVEIPLLFMTYANIVLSQGIESFVEDSKSIGIDGFIIPDLAVDTPEGKVMYDSCQKASLEMIPLYAPTMSAERYKLLADHTQNLLYAVSRTGVTGVKGVSTDLTEYLEKIRLVTDAHIALGFGIQSHEQISDLRGKVDTAVIGSHLLRTFDEKGIEGVKTFLQDARNIV